MTEGQVGDSASVKGIMLLVKDSHHAIDLHNSYHALLNCFVQGRIGCKVNITHGRSTFNLECQVFYRR